MNNHLLLKTNSLFHCRKDMSGVTTLDSPSPRGQIHLNYMYPKEDVENLKNPKGALEELSAEYGFTKPSYILVKSEGLAHNSTFYVTRTLIDCKHNKTFTEISNGENKLKNAEHEAERKIRKILKYSFYFSEERNIDNKIEDIYVLCQDKESRMLIKLYKSEQCCEYCYLREHRVENCSRKIKRNKNFKENYTIKEEEFWNPVDNTKNQNLIYTSL